MKEQEVYSIDEVTEPNVRYFLVTGEEKFRTGRELLIEESNLNKYGEADGESKYYTLTWERARGSGGFYNFATVGDYVREWKTFKGVIRYIRLKAAQGDRRFKDWLTAEELGKVEKALAAKEAAKFAAEQKAYEERMEARRQYEAELAELANIREVHMAKF